MSPTRFLADAGKNAQRELVLLDIDRNPGNYVKVGAALDKSNAIFARIGNATCVELGDIGIRVVWLYNQGQTQRAQRVFKGPLAAGQEGRLKLDLDLDLTNPRELNQRLQLEVTSARVVP